MDKEINQEIELYASEQEAEDKIEEYLQSPPQLRAISKDTKCILIQLPNMLTEYKLIFCYKFTVKNNYFNSAIKSNYHQSKRE